MKNKQKLIIGVISLAGIIFISNFFISNLKNEAILVSEYHDKMSFPSIAILGEIDLEFHFLHESVHATSFGNEGLEENYYKSRDKMLNLINQYYELTYVKSLDGEYFASPEMQNMMLKISSDVKESLGKHDRISEDLFFLDNGNDNLELFKLLEEEEVRFGSIVANGITMEIQGKNFQQNKIDVIKQEEQIGLILIWISSICAAALLFFVIFTSTTKEIDEIKKISEDLGSSESKYRNLYEDSPDLYRTINTDGIILNCNQSYAHNLGYTKKEIIGKSIFEHVSSSDKEAMRNSFETWRDTGRVKNTNVIFKRKDSSTFPVIVSASNLYDDNDKLIGSNTIIRDMSELRDAEKKIGYEKLKRLSVIGELTSRVSHDLLNPLTVIKNSLFLLKSIPGEIDKDTTDEYKRLERAVLRMTIQIEDVLDFVKKKPLVLKSSYVSEIMKQVMERIKISENVMINLPKNDEQIICDHKKLEIVFINLIMNAMQAMNHKGKIDIRVSDKDNYILIEIEDSGPGIPADLLPKIFDPLFTTRDVGTGLGLVSCKNIVERHGGTIEVETVVGKGTTFTIKLPKMVKEIVQK